MSKKDEVMKMVLAEVYRAEQGFPPMRSAHEGWAILREEVDELWEEVRDKMRDRDRMKSEAVQVAAMAIRFVLDVCEVEDV
jgi:hypothetical protein